MSFDRVVADWLRSTGKDVAEIVSVEAYGTDWAGDTEGGFYDESDVTIKYRSEPDGKVNYLEVRGEEMGALWQFVMNAWPEEDA